MELNLRIQGMTGATCVERIERVLHQQTGVVDAHVNLASESARVVVRPEATMESVLNAIEQAGYRAKLARASAAPVESPVWPAALSWALSFPLLAPSALAWFGIAWALPMPAQFFLATLVQLFWAGSIYAAAWDDARQRRASLNVLALVASTSAYGYALWQWGTRLETTALHSTMGDCFAAASVVITLAWCARLLQARVKRQAALAVHQLMSLRPAMALVRRGERDVFVKLEEIIPGDQVVVRATERIPVDGVIIEGGSFVDLCLISGQTQPVSVTLGDRVLGGALNLDGFIIVRAARSAAQSQISSLVRGIERALSAHAESQFKADIFIHRYVLAVLWLAVVVAAAWGLIDNLHHGIAYAMAWLTAGCALAWPAAAPAARVAGVAAAARAGILLRTTAALELATRLRVVAFNKSGTVTRGVRRVHALEPMPGVAASELATMAGALCAQSTHPLARAVQAYVEKTGLPALTEWREIPGEGIEAQYAGRHYFFGHLRRLAERGLTTPVRDDAYTRAWLIEQQGDEARLMGAVVFLDRVRTSASVAVSSLHERGLHVALLSGDSAKATKEAARRIGADSVAGNLTPDAKRDMLAKLQRDLGSTAWVCGVDEAHLGLHAVDLPMVIRPDSDTALESAPISLMRSDLRLVPAALEIARRCRAAMHANLFLAVSINLLCLLLVALGGLTLSTVTWMVLLPFVLVWLNTRSLEKWRHWW